MDERSRLINGRFLHNLNGWTISGAEYSPGDGDDHYGVAVLSTGGDYIEQSFSVIDTRLHTLHLSAKCANAVSGAEVRLILTDGEGDTVVTANIPITAAAWTELSNEYGLAPGTAYTLKIINNTAGADVKIDDVWVWPLPITRANVAARTAAKLADLATENSLSTSQSGALTEGDYTYAIDAALRQINAINPETGSPDARYADPEDVNTLLNEAELEILYMLRRTYALKTDIRVGPRDEKLSQIGAAIDTITGIAGDKRFSGKPGRVEVRRLTRS